MKRIFICINFFLCLNAFTQSSFLTYDKLLDLYKRQYDKSTVQRVKTLDSLILNSNLNDSVNFYYQTVYQAEKAIMKSNYKKAAKLYEKAFLYKKTPFYNDLTNAIYCELKGEQNPDKLKNNLCKYAKTGRDMSEFYDKLPKTMDINEIKKMTDTINPSFNIDLAKYFGALTKTDQAYRTEVSEIYNSERQMEIMKSKEFIDSLHKIDKDNYTKLLYLLDNFKFNEYDFDKNWTALGLLLIHHNRFDNLEFYIKTYKYVKDGILDARNYVNNLQNSVYSELLTDFCQNSYGWYINEDFYSYTIPLKTALKSANKIRKHLYLDDVLFFHKKAAWQITQENSGLVISYAKKTEVTDSFFHEDKTQKRNDFDLYKFVILEKGEFNDKLIINYNSPQLKKTLRKEVKEYFKIEKNRQELEKYKKDIEENGKEYLYLYEMNKQAKKDFLKEFE